MTKLIIGSYHSKEDAVNAVTSYELQGHSAKNIVILTNQSNTKEIEELTDVAVKSSSPVHEAKKTFTDKIKDAFTHNKNLELDTPDKLVEFGLSSEDARTCMADVDLGKIVVLADNELRMGQAPPFESDQ